MTQTCQNEGMDDDKGITSPFLRVGSKSRTSIPTKSLDADCQGLHQPPKHGYHDSDDADDEVSPSECQQPVKRKKANMTSPIKSGSNYATGEPFLDHPPSCRGPLSLPEQINHIVNLGAPHQKRAWRTLKEMAASAVAMKKEKLRLSLEKLEREKIQMLAEMDALEPKLEEDSGVECSELRDITDIAGCKAAGDDNVTMSTSEEEAKDKSEGPAKMVRSLLMLKMPVTYCTVYFLR